MLQMQVFGIRQRLQQLQPTPPRSSEGAAQTKRLLQV
jgi:hypothetical protein